MRQSTLFGKTVYQPPQDAQTASHKLLYQGGFIRESTAGRYYYLPLGQRVQRKIMDIVKRYMDAAGAQEALTPVLHPLELWKETNRTNTAGFELTTLKDRRGAEFALGGTAEEMMVDLVRKFQISYRDLPFHIYQFSTKFRDELRARGGLLRVREFIMKDGYSFHTSADDFKKEYDRMGQVYTSIFAECGLTTHAVESDNGYIGGEYCHEYVVESPIGESVFFMTEDGSYAAHQDVAVCAYEDKNVQDPLKELTEVSAERGTTIQDGVAFHKLPDWQQIKNVLYVNQEGAFVLAVIRGDLDVNEEKLKHITSSLSLRHATAEEIRSVIHSEPGFLSAVGIRSLCEPGTKLMIVADTSLATIRNAYTGANKLNRDYLNVNIDRDVAADQVADIALAKEGYLSKKDRRPLIRKRGIEVGNIFQLGTHYTSRMANAFFTAQSGKRESYYMGCYGIGIGRTLAAIVEAHHDERGIVWPRSVAPFSIHLLSFGKDEAVRKQANDLYQELTQRNRDVLFDDRDISPGAKFADADLIGIPIRLVVSPKTEGKIEYKERSKQESQLVTKEHLYDLLSAENIS